MISVRFHGRGGHGVKTASRILGTAAFLAGYEVQDSPVYGAERRGAAVTAYTRVGEEPILERGVIEHPSLIIVADQTLLEDPAARVLAGQEQASAVFVNTTASSDALTDRFGVHAPSITLDLTTRSLEVLGCAAALSAALGAVAARLSAVVKESNLGAAVESELSDAGLTRAEIDANEELALEVFEALEPIAIRQTVVSSHRLPVSIAYEGPFTGSPSILRAGNAVDRHTGSWRVERPELDHDACTRCAICFVRCPDGAIALDAKGYPIIDYDHCKGCLICLQECPLNAISRVKEVSAW